MINFINKMKPIDVDNINLAQKENMNCAHLSDFKKVWPPTGGLRAF